jgi:CRISPR/Cas system CSM-associated protein Csm4 (group 5 of RAMP superfamily)
MLIEFAIIDSSDHSQIKKIYLLSMIQSKISEWRDIYGIETDEKTVKYRHRLCFFDEKHYSFFLMTFDLAEYNHLVSMRLVQDRNR